MFMISAMLSDIIRATKSSLICEALKTHVLWSSDHQLLFLEISLNRYVKCNKIRFKLKIAFEYSTRTYSLVQQQNISMIISPFYLCSIGDCFHLSGYPRKGVSQFHRNNLAA